LAQAVPDYEALNVDNDFLEWLKQVDPLSGISKQVYLNAAFEQMDAQRTANLFNAFKEAAGKTQQTARPDPKAELQRQVAPGTSKADVPSSSTNTKIWAMREIEQFFTDVSKGKYTRDEAAKIEAEIDAAVAAGRLK
jgi:hypothetical protein